MKFAIHASHLEDAVKTMEKMTKKATKLGITDFGFKLSEAYVVGAQKTLPNGDVIDVKKTYYDIEVEGFEHAPSVGGYSIVARIDVYTEGNVVAAMEDMPAHFRTTDCHCDHCNVKTYRKNVFVLRNNETGEFIQVGRSCLKDYMTDRELAAIMWKFSYKMEVEAASERNEDFEGFFGSSPSGYDLEEFILAAVMSIRADGWVSKSVAMSNEHLTPTIASISNLLAHKKPKDYARYLETVKKDAGEIVKTIIAFVDTLGDSDFDHNLKVVVKHLKFVPYKYASMVAYLPQAYFKSLEDAATKAAKEAARLARLEAKAANADVPQSEFQGTIGGKLAGIAVTVLRTNVIEGHYDYTHIYKFADKLGNIYNWFSSNDMKLEVGEEKTITVATVKDHKIYNDEKETLITRAKLA